MAHFKVTDTETGSTRYVRARLPLQAKRHVLDARLVAERVPEDEIIDLLQSDPGIKIERAQTDDDTSTAAETGVLQQAA